MSELMAFIYESETGAKDLELNLIEVQNAQNVKVGDAALVVRQADGRPQFNHAVDLVGRGSMGGIFWGFILAFVEDGMVEAVLEAAESSNPKVLRSTFIQADEQVLQTIFQAARGIA